MIVRFAGGPLAGRVLTTSAPWPGGWVKAEGAEWALYRPVHRDPASGIVLAEIQETGHMRTTGQPATGPDVPSARHDLPLP